MAQLRLAPSGPYQTVTGVIASAAVAALELPDDATVVLAGWTGDAPAGLVTATAVLGLKYVGESGDPPVPYDRFLGNWPIMCSVNHTGGALVASLTAQHEASGNLLATLSLGASVQTLRIGLLYTLADWNVTLNMFTTGGLVVIEA